MRRRLFTAGCGLGRLTIVDGNAEDAAVILASNTTTSGDRLLYIRAGMWAVMSGIPTGQYRIKFQVGQYWDDQAEAFRCVKATGVFDRLAMFEERAMPDAIEYSDISITLHKIVGGNARTTDLPQAEFHRRRTP